MRPLLYKNVILNSIFLLSFVHKHGHRNERATVILTMDMLHCVITMDPFLHSYDYIEKLCKRIWELQQYIIQWSRDSFIEIEICRHIHKLGSDERQVSSRAQHCHSLYSWCPYYNWTTRFVTGKRTSVNWALLETAYYNKYYSKFQPLLIC